MEFREYRMFNDSEFVFEQPLLDGYASEAVSVVVNSKERILSLMKKPVFEVKRTDGIGYVSYVSVCENGIRIDYHIDVVGNRPEEFASLYLFNNGDIFYVFGGLLVPDFGYVGGNPEITYHLESRLGRTYELMEREKGVKGLFGSASATNKKLIELCKLQFEKLILPAKYGIEFTEYDDNNQKVLRV